MFDLSGGSTWEQTFGMEPGFAGPTESLLFHIRIPKGSAFWEATLVGCSLWIHVSASQGQDTKINTYLKAKFMVVPE